VQGDLKKAVALLITRRATAISQPGPELGRKECRVYRALLVHHEPNLNPKN
jgi:hypothetical protein